MSARIQTNAPPLAWLQRHGAEGGVSCAELERREAEAGEKLSMTSYGMTLAEASAILARWAKEDADRMKGANENH